MAGDHSPNGRPQAYEKPFSSSNDYEVRESRPLSKYNAEIPSAGISPIRGILPRTISYANLELTNQSKDIVKRDFVRDAPRGGTNFFHSTPTFTLIIPSLDHLAGFKSYVLDVLVDSSVLKSLVDEHIINWCCLVTKVVPLNTIGDGNCLLHAASLGMWGFQDRQHILRNALYDALACRTENTLYERWRQCREVENDRVGLELTPDIWEKEWQNVKYQAGTDIMVGQNLDGLDDFHVFVLANVLRRPIVMYASSKYRSICGGGSLQELNFEGVYLPLLWHASSCKRSPLPLTFCNGHFSALTVVESPDQYKNGHLVLPLVDCHGRHFPIKFTMAIEDKSILCMEYLDLIQKRIYEDSPAVSCSKLTIPDKSDNFVKSLASAFISSYGAAFEQENSIGPGWEFSTPSRGRGDGKGAGYQDERRETSGEETHYCKNKCGNYGEAKYSYFCFQCHQECKLVSSHSGHGPVSTTFQPHPRPRSKSQMGDQNLSDLDNSHRLKSGMPNHAGSDKGRGSLKCSECSEPGYPQFLGMCRRCYNRTQSADGGTIYETLLPASRVSLASEEPPSVPLPRNLKERSLCRKKDCTFFGTEEYRFYCSKCFESNLSSILKEADQKLPISDVLPPRSNPAHMDPRKEGRSDSSSASNPPKCRNCYEYFASVEYNGLCYECFLKSTLPSGGSSLASSGVSRMAFTELHRSSRGGMRGGAEKRRSVGSYDYPMYASQLTRTQQHPLPSGKEDGHLPNMITPIHSISSQLQATSLHAKCIICSGEDNLHSSESETFVFCKRHAIEAQRSSCGGRREELPATMGQGGETGYYYANDLSDERQTHNEGGNRSLEHRRSSAEQGRIGDEFSRRPGGGEQRQYLPSENYAQQVDRSNQRHHSSRTIGGDAHHYTSIDPQQNRHAYQDGNHPRERRLPSDDGHNDGGGDGAAGTSVNDDDDDGTMQKILCALPGCSYLPYKELEGCCPDCYEDLKKVVLDRNKFPQI